MSDANYQVVNGVSYRYSSDWLQRLESPEHWLLYRKQQELMQNIVKPAHHVLEIGPGTGFTSNILKAGGVKVTTIDIDEAKQPDIHANIVTFQPSQKYDHILAFEVLEHIPYEESLKVLEKFRSYTRNIFVSVPVNEVRLFKIHLDLPVIKKLSWEVYVPRKKIEVKNHFWEVKYGKYKEKKVFQDFKALGYRVLSRQKYLSKLFFVLRSEGEDTH